MRKKLWISLLLINILFLGIFVVQEHYGKLTETYDINCTTPEGVISEYVFAENDEIHIPFQSLLHSVDNIILKFSGCLGFEDGLLSVEIFNQDKTIYTYEIPVAAITTDDFYLHTGAIPELHEDESYEIVIKVKDLSQQTMALYLAKGNHFVPEDEQLIPFWGYTGTMILSTDVRVNFILFWVIFDIAYVVMLAFFKRIFTEDRKRKIAEWARYLGGKLKKANKGIHICFALLLVLCVASGIAVMQYEEVEEPRNVNYWTVGNVSNFTGVSLQEGQVVQEFAAKGGELQEFILFFDNYSATEDADVWVKLEDEAGNVRYVWTAPISALGGNTFCLVGHVNQEFSKGEKCIIRAYLEGGESQITVRGLSDKEYAEEFHASVGDVTVDGQQLDDIKLYFFQSYQLPLVYPAIWGAAFAVTLVTLLLMVWCDAPLLKKVLKVFSDVCLILISYCTMELLSGNIYTIDVGFVLLNCVIMLCGYGIITAIAGKAAYYIVALLTFAAGITNYYVLLFKGSDFLLTEISAFSTAMSVTGTYEFTVTPVVFTTVVLYVCMILMRVSIDLNRERISRKRNIVRRAVALVVSLAVALVLNWGVQYIPFDYFTLSTNFEGYGWWYSNAIVVKNSKMKRPMDYSDKEIERILSEIEAPEGQEIVPTNIIVIMNEALSDLSMIGQLDTNQDFLPFIRSLSENTVKGNVHVHTYGGGTAISEYEFLTGNSFQFMPTGSMPYSNANRASGEPGMASTLKDQGYYAVAMHPYGPANWNRDQVYEAMGFDEFISIDAFEGEESIRDYVSDKANYKKIIECHEANQGEKLFVFNVTMQNHGGYGIANGAMDTTISVNNIVSDEAEIYLSLIQKTDEAFEYLISYFSQVEEPTMIVMFGDHLPALPDEFYTALYGKEYKDRSLAEHMLRCVTPYIIWTNYDSDFETVADTSLNYLGRMVLQYAGVELSKYDQFVLQQSKKIPVIGTMGIVELDGSIVGYANVPDSRLKDYQILQYMRVEDRDSKYFDIFRLTN